MSRIVLIEASEVVSLTPINEKTSPNIFSKFISDVEDEIFADDLGLEFYKDLLESRNENNEWSNDEYKFLFDKGLGRYIAFCVLQAALPFETIEFSGIGLQKRLSDNTEVASDRDYARFSDAIKTNKLRVRKRLERLLVDNDHYKLYTGNQIIKKKPKKVRRNGGFILPNLDERPIRQIKRVFESNKKTYEYEADENGYFEIDFSDIKAVGENITIVVKNSSGTTIDEFDINVNFDTANQTLEAWIETQNENDYSGTIEVTVNK